MTDVLGLNVLTVLILLPIVGAALVFIIPDDQKRLARWLALGISLAVLVMALGIFYDVQQHPLGPDEWAFEERADWFPQIGASWHLGVDGLSASMILLTGLLVPLSILIAFESDERVPQYMALFLFLEAGMLGVFCALDLMVFFLFWEVGLVPMYFLIFLWGGANRRYAANKFFLYTMAGSLGLLLATQFIGLNLGTFDIPTAIREWPLKEFDQFQLFGFTAIFNWDPKYFALLGFAVAFLIKMPAWPFHTWLPDAHTEAPTAGSMLLAGVLLKLGAYGFLRLAIPLFPAEWIAIRAADFLPFMLVHVIGAMAMLGIILGGLAAWGQNDFKRLVAYSSVNHMGFVVLGLAVAALMYGMTWAEEVSTSTDPQITSRQRNMAVTLLAGVADIDPNGNYSQTLAGKVDEVYTQEFREEDRQDARTALNGAILQMFNHGLSSAGMFLLAGALYHKAHTRDLRRFGGLWDIAPFFGGLLIFVSMASLGLPGLNGFVGEFLVVAGSFRAFPEYVLLSMFGLLVTGIYILKGIQMLLHGPKNEEWAEYHENVHSLEIDRREVVALAPLVALMLITGLYPNWVLDVINSGVTNWFGFIGF